MEQYADDGEVTYEQVTVVSLAASAPVGPARTAVRVVREAMTVKRIAGYWVRWDERRAGEELRHHARWVPEEEYVRPGTGRPDGTLSVTVAAYWADARGAFRHRPGTETAVTFRPGEGAHELVLEQPAPAGPSALSVQLADARWLGAADGGPIHYGFSGATEAATGGEGAWLVRHPEYGTGGVGDQG
ncbi:hypothetical protein ACFY2K_39680 [Kitasatospora sp. NPDC001309]